MNESSLILYDGRIVSMSRGSAFEVEFEFQKVWDLKKKTPNFNPDRLVWLHAHPPGVSCQASMQDVRCAQGLKIAFGKLGAFGIVCFTDADLNSYDGEIAWYQFDENHKLVIETIDKISIGTPALYMLKAVAVASPNKWTEGSQSD